MAICGNGNHELEEFIGSATLGSRRFSINLKTSVAEILIVIVSDSEWKR